MAFTSVYIIVLITLLVPIIAETTDEVWDGKSNEGSATTIVFAPNNEKNESGSTPGISGWNETSTVGHNAIKYPLVIGPWIIRRCHNDEDSWGCELTRLMRTATDGFIDTLKFVMQKDNSLKVANTKERCGGGCGGGYKAPFRVMVKCPKTDYNDRKDKVISRLKAMHFQAGFLCAMGLVLATLLMCLCCAWASKRTPEENANVKLIAQRPDRFNKV